MKITISGWPGAGSSSLSLILANKLGIKLIRGTETFRYLGKNLNFGDHGNDRIKADIMLEKDFGPLYDKYIDAILLDEKLDNILIESDIAVFRVGRKPTIFSIFLLTEREVRAERVVEDGRAIEKETLAERDEANRQFFLELHNVDWFDEKTIEEKHSMLLENSTISIAEELRAIYIEMGKQGYLPRQKVLALVSESDSDEKEYWENGKKHLEKILTDKSAITTAEDVLTDIKTRFPDEVKTLPVEIRSIIQDIV